MAHLFPIYQSQTIAWSKIDISILNDFSVKSIGFDDHPLTLLIFLKIGGCEMIKMIKKYLLIY